MVQNSTIGTAIEWNATAKRQSSVTNAMEQSAGRSVDVEEKRLEIAARDGYRLGATLYVRAKQGDPANAVVFNAGGGLSTVRYRFFLRYLAAEGFPVLAYDYRGVGISSPASWRGFDAGIEDWTEFDQAGAIDALRARYPAARLMSVSHSIGCMFAAAAPNASSLSQMVFIAPHTAYCGDYKQPWRLPMTLLWHVLMPGIARTVGYFPGSRLALGDDFPRRVALQWASRRTPDYRPGASGADAYREAGIRDRMLTLALPALVISMTDDAFAPEVAVRRFLAGAPHVEADVRLVDPKTLPHAVGGHLGVFSRRNVAIWASIADVLNGR
jgi:predicted alpha/beta hydrolase